jgi:phosphopantetheine--protein transferase-like protein
LPERWAAKEAIIKASRRKIFMTDIMIYPGPSTPAPVAVILDAQLETNPDIHGQSVLLTISHEREYAVATAVVPD